MESLNWPTMMRGKSKLALMCRTLVWSRPTSCSMRPVVQWEAPARRWFQRAGQPYLHLHLWRGRFDKRPRVIALQAVLLYRRQSFHFRIRQIVAARLTISLPRQWFRQPISGARLPNQPPPSLAVNCLYREASTQSGARTHTVKWAGERKFSVEAVPRLKKITFRLP